MTFLKAIRTTFLASIFVVNTFATTWAPIYPYTQKTERGNIKSHSIPYAVNDGGYGPGETFVYANGKLLYSINKYFTSPFFTANNGQYLIEFDFYLGYQQPYRLIDESGKMTIEPAVYDGNAVNIYKDGKLFKSIKFSELKIDTSKIKINESVNWFAWHYNISDTIKDKLKIKMGQHPAFIEGDKICLITADNQLVVIEIATGQITNRLNAYETLKQKSKWKPTVFKRKYKKIKYPDKFLLPTLQNGKTIKQGLAEFLNRRASDGEEDSTVIKVYFHTLLINKEGKCEEVYTSPSIRNDIKKNNYFDDPKLKLEIESWIKIQTFNTETFPKGFPKYNYSDFVYLK